jgi:dihydropteroate synthase
MRVQTYKLNIRGEITTITRPLVMGILNVTPDSFYAESRSTNEINIRETVIKMVSEGVDCIDIGGYSSRPGADHIPENNEIERIKPALEILNSEFPQIITSIDTFRANVAEWALKNYEVDIINDISAGQLEPKIHNVVAEAGKIYIGMHMIGNPQNMQANASYKDLLKEIKLYFAKLEEKVTRLGINDLIIDPGFGFSKTLDQNYELLNHLDELSIINRPILVGLSRKSMIYNQLNIKPEESLCGTIALNTIALLKGASIIRVHDVKQAVEAVKLIEKTICK